MYHETSVIFNTQEPWAREAVTTKYQDCDKGYHSHQEQYRKKKKKKNLYSLPVETIANVSHVHNFFTDSRLNITEKNKNTVSSPECAVDCKWMAAVFPPTGTAAICEGLSVITNREQLGVKTRLLTDQGWRASFTFDCFGGERVPLFNKRWLSLSYTQSTQSLSSDKGSWSLKCAPATTNKNTLVHIYLYICIYNVNTLLDKGPLLQHCIPCDQTGKTKFQ